MAQRATQPRKKPFAEFSESAQRLMDSLTVDLVGDADERALPLVDQPFTDSLIAVARSQLGARYRLGAAAPDRAWDCSALVRFVMGALRIDLPRTAHLQSQHGLAVARDVERLRPGDLLTFGTSKTRVSHIGLYVGDGKFVHASVSARQVVESSIDRPNTWYRRHWLGVRRLVALREPADTIGT
jgi:cell wall-associated NlpC family hydrolase